MNLIVTPIDPTEDPRWDAFVMSHPEATVYHHSSWAKVIRTTYGHEIVYLALEDDENRIWGIAPFIFIKSCLTGKRIVSLPFAAHCNPILPIDKFENILYFLLEHYADVDYIELKVVEKEGIKPPNGFVKRSDFVTHILNLEQSLEELFVSFHSTSVRQRIRKGEKKKLSLKLGENEDDLRQFYQLHSIVRKKHGLPPHPYAFFAQIWHTLRPQKMVSVPLIMCDNQAVSAAFILKFKDTFYFEQSATDPNYLKDCANQIMIWESIKLAHADGASYFDFGRSALINRPLIEFKERWNAKGVALSSYYYPECPSRDKETSPGRKVLSRINHILPISMLQLQGRLLYPHLG